ncbi:MAG: 6,7-dimethyl-8-ribityllumazine synthase [Planctomycetes bacterium]|nr:6,7-dimethyl-8-ribityllumazine synthase [Planctomycetota bacterium]
MQVSSAAKAPIDGKGRRIAIVVARFNPEITERLAEGARRTLLAAGVAPDAITVLSVPGAFELPLACRWAIESGRFDAMVALGAVIRGETDHYDYVCGEASRGIADTQLATGVPIGFGLLTCDTPEQALARAGGSAGDGSAGNKGEDAAHAALAMLALRDALDGSTRR